MFHKDRDHRGGGVGFYIKKHVICKLATIDIPNDSALESIAISFKIGKTKVCWGTIYMQTKIQYDGLELLISLHLVR